MNIVFLETDTLGNDISLEHFHELGTVTTYNKSEPEKNAERLKDADILVVNKIPINKDLLENASKLKLIAASATGTNNIDFNYTRSRGILVSNARDYSTPSVVQHTFALLFYLYEKLSTYDHFVKDGDYSNYPMFSCFTPYFNELSGKTWGIIGLGAIGRGVAKIATAFGCKVIYYSTSGKNSTTDYSRVDFPTLLSTSDIISIHCPLNNETFELINSKTIELMQRHAFLLNLGRGPIINESDLADALIKGKIAGAGLDVLCTEPLPAENPLMKIKDSSRLIITPHMAWGTREARARCIQEVYRNIQSFIKGNPRNIVD